METVCYNRKSSSFTNLTDFVQFGAGTKLYSPNENRQNTPFRVVNSREPSRNWRSQAYIAAKKREFSTVISKTPFEVIREKKTACSGDMRASSQTLQAAEGALLPYSILNQSLMVNPICEFL